VSNKYKPGDLVILNQYGIFITSDYNDTVAVILSESYSIVAPVEATPDTFYTVYDILLDEKLFKMVPEEFMERYNPNETNIERMEDVVGRNQKKRKMEKKK